jgi:hypothetical protein
MRIAIALAVCAACEPRFVAPPVPDLVAAGAPVGALDVPALQLVPNEQLIWDVQVRGMTIGAAELDVDDDTVTSRFRTTGLAGTMHAVEYMLVTQVDRVAARPAHASERLVEAGEVHERELAFEAGRVVAGERTLAVPAGKVGHTLHTALGVVRAWARPRAAAGYVYVVHAGELFELALREPVAVQLHGVHVLRVDGAIARENIAIQLWITDDDRRIPLRIEVRSDDVVVVAELAG